MNKPTASKCSFFSIAAWYCLIAPFTTYAIAWLAYLLEGDTRYHPFGDPALDVSFWACVSAVPLGVVSLFGIPRHGVKVIVWKALIGIGTGFIFGCFGFLGIYSRIARQ